MGTSQKSEIVSGLVTTGFALVGVLYFVPTWVKLPSKIAVETLSPAFWPTILFYGLMSFGIIIVITAFIEKANAEIRSDSSPAKGSLQSAVIRTMFAIALLFAYYYMIEPLGLVVASILSSGALMLLAGERQFTTVAVISCIVPVALYYFFTLVANTPLPLGIFDFF